MSTAAASTSKVAAFVKSHLGRAIVAMNPQPPESGPTTYVIHDVDTKTVGLRADNGGGKGEYVILVKKGDDTKQIKLNPNIVMDLLNGKEVKDYELGATEHNSPFPTSADAGGNITTSTDNKPTAEAGAEGEAGKTDAPAAEDEAKKAAAAEKEAAKQKREQEAAAKKQAKEAKKAEREKAAADKKAREEQEAKARLAKQADKEKNSGKLKALRVFRAFDANDADRRKKVMSIFRAPESEGGFGWSNQHANTYYQNCKDSWKDYKLGEEDAAAAKQIRADYDAKHAPKQEEAKS